MIFLIEGVTTFSFKAGVEGLVLREEGFPVRTRRKMWRWQLSSNSPLAWELAPNFTARW
jgi:hypothetical protein